MVPTRIVATARQRGLDIIGICDHNSAENVAAVQECASDGPLVVLGGMEISSAEEVHLMGFFRDHASLMGMQEYVQSGLEGKNEESMFGYQWIVDSEDQAVGRSDRLLIGSTTFSVEEIVDMIHEYHGLAVASHIDRESFGLVGQLGFVPPDLALDAVEVSFRYRESGLVDLRSLPLPAICSSDAHALDDIGKVHTVFDIKEPTFDELAAAFAGVGGRSVSLLDA